MRAPFLAALVCLFGQPLHADPPWTWSFAPEPDRFSEDALLDLSFLNEDTAGETGFVRRSSDGASFVRGDGAPIRFWALNTYVAGWSMPSLREHARFLAKRGVNMVRLHGQIAQAGEEGGPLEAINTAERDRLWQLVAAMKDEGIYVTFSPYYPHNVHEAAARRWQVPVDSPGLAGLIYFDPVLQAAYKGWLRDTLTTVNPYTGVALMDDPALAIIQMQNEDSLLFWTFNDIGGREASLLSEGFGQFLIGKYGTLDATRDAWGGAVARGALANIKDDWDTGVIALSNIWHLTEEAPQGDAAQRLSDQAAYLTQTMRDWHAEVARFLRDDIGAPQLFNAGNWRTADDIYMDDLERYAYTSGDVIGVNRYVTAPHEGEHAGWAIVAGDRFREDGLLHRPLDLPVTLRQPAGYPYIISETLWVPPMWEQAEGPVLMAAYQALTGIDISYWFATGDVQWHAPQSANGYLPSVGKWVVASPQQMGGFPAAALMFRRGLLDEAPPVIIENRTLEALWSRSAPRVAARQGYDPNRDEDGGFFAGLFGDESAIPTTQSPYSFLVGPVHLNFDSDAPDFMHPELAAHIDADQKTVTSLTQELTWNWDAGVVTIDAPRAQGIVGSLSSRASHDLSDITLESSAPYASVIAVPLDDAPIATTRRLLVQINSIARPTGWATRPVQHEDGAALEVMSFGTAPWQIDRVMARLQIQNPHLKRATVLDANGMARGAVPVRRDSNGLALNLPDDALYVMID